MNQYFVVVVGLVLFLVVGSVTIVIVDWLLFGMVDELYGLGEVGEKSRFTEGIAHWENLRGARLENRKGKKEREKEETNEIFKKSGEFWCTF